jgi:phospholipid/cholesterol/gamma-HCH transport system ATP-binding protein
MNDLDPIQVHGLTLAYGQFVVLRDLDFTVPKGSIFFIIGNSGCGKSTLLRSLVGLLPPVTGRVVYSGQSFFDQSAAQRDATLRRFGVTFQTGGLITSMTLAENVGLPLEQFTRLQAEEIQETVAFKLSLVGLRGSQVLYPGQLSVGMQKRAGLARAIALDPEILFFDEPSAGLDPVTSQRLDRLILELRDSLAATVVIVSHELRSIFAIGDLCVYLDISTRTISARGSPEQLRRHPPNERVAEFLAGAGGGSNHA